MTLNLLLMNKSPNNSGSFELSALVFITYISIYLLEVMLKYKILYIYLISYSSSYLCKNVFFEIDISNLKKAFNIYICMVYRMFLITDTCILKKEVNN